jgi:DNA modification methylase
MTNEKKTLFTTPLLDWSNPEEEQNTLKSSDSKRHGPPNRMNDLTYSDWMKFQKSFFWHTSHANLVRECIEFFTKEVWADAHCSHILLIGFSVELDDIKFGRRHIDSMMPSSFAELIQVLEKMKQAEQEYDFIFVNLTPLLHTSTDLTIFLEKWADSYFSLLRSLTCSQQYCGMLIDLPEVGGNGFPLPWAVALAGRNHLRLRDEKIGLIEAENKVYYCLFMQSLEDTRAPAFLDSEVLHVARENQRIVPWVMPKSPPRKKNEILHPAKFPESLIEQFIDEFTQPGDNVLDPMVGTGSTVLAAVKHDRNGFGVDLNQEFVDISLNRLSKAHPTFLFDELNSSSRGTILHGDATRLNELPELRTLSFNYCVTSPPYWSMLSNPGSENQRTRRQRNLPLIYSNHDLDLGNVEDYDEFLVLLQKVYDQVALKLLPGGHLTVIVKNVKRNHILYPLAWDLTARLCGPHGKYDYVGTTLWCQNDVGLKPFAVGIYWVSNILHHYCLHFRRRDRL